MWDPTQAVTYRDQSPNLLTQIGSVASRSNLDTVTQRLAAALGGTETPALAVRMVDRLLQVSQQTPGVQGSLRDEDVAGGLVDLGFAYGRLNPLHVTDADLLSQLPFQQLWQATDAAGVQAARPGIESFFAGFSGPIEHQTLVKNQAYLLDHAKTEGLLDPQELRDPQQIHNLMAAHTYLIAPHLPVPSRGTEAAGSSENPSAAGSSEPAAPETLQFLSSGSGQALPPFDPFGSSLYNPDGTPKFYPRALNWEIQIPVHNYYPAATLVAPNKPNYSWSVYTTSFGGAQVDEIYTMLSNRQDQIAFVTAFNSVGEVVTWGHGPLAAWLVWEPEFGFGNIIYRGAVGDAPLPKQLETSLGLSESGSTEPNASDPEWEPSPAPQPGSPGAEPTRPGVERRPLPGGGTAPVKPSPIQPYSPRRPEAIH